MPAHDFPLSFDLSKPEINFADMARSMGVQSIRVEKPWEVGAAIQQMLAHPGPFLIDLVIHNEIPEPVVHPKAGQ